MTEFGVAIGAAGFFGGLLVLLVGALFDLPELPVNILLGACGAATIWGLSREPKRRG